MPAKATPAIVDMISLNIISLLTSLAPMLGVSRSAKRARYPARRWRQAPNATAAIKMIPCAVSLSG